MLKALYSVPTRHIGKILEARADRKTMRMYLGAELIKAHPRKGPGQRSTDHKDFPPGKAAWAVRDVDSVLRKAREYAKKVGQSTERFRPPADPELCALLGAERNFLDLVAPPFKKVPGARLRRFRYHGMLLALAGRTSCLLDEHPTRW